MPRGRPASVREVYSFESASLIPPREVVLDTCFVGQALIVGEPQHRECQSFLLRLVEAGSLLCFNRLLEVELVEVALRLAIKERHGKSSWQERRKDGRVRRRAGRIATDLMESWAELLTSVDHLCVEPGDVVHLVPDLMATYPIASMDAVHVATCEYLSVRSVATTDVGFGVVPSSRLTIYTDRSRVSATRNRRGGKSRT